MGWQEPFPAISANILVFMKNFIKNTVGRGDEMEVFSDRPASEMSLGEHVLLKGEIVLRRQEGRRCIQCGDSRDRTEALTQSRVALHERYDFFRIDHEISI